MRSPTRPFLHAPALALSTVLLAVLAVLASLAPAHALDDDDPTDPGGPALRFTKLQMGASPAYGGRQGLLFTTNYSAQETVATVYYTPSNDTPLTDVLATSDKEGTISWPTSPRFKPGSYSVTLEVVKESSSVTSSRLTFTVSKAGVTSIAAVDDLRVAQYRPVDLSLTVSSTAADAPLRGAYTLLAKPVGGGPDVSVKEGGYEGAGPHVLSLQQFAATHPGVWELYFLTSETDLLAFGSTRVARLEVLPSRVPTALALDPGTTTHEYGDPSAAISASLTSGFDVAGLAGRVRLLDRGVPTGDEVEVTGPGTVTFPLGALAVGEHSLSLEFLGNDVFEGSASPARAVTVTKPGEQDPDPEPDHADGPAKTTFAAQVTGRVKLKRARRVAVVKAAVVAPGRAAPLAGQVQVLVGKKVVRTVDIAATNGVVKVKVKGLKPGKRKITVRYLGAPDVVAAAAKWKVKVPRR
ncbi:Ig-like domain-containing protein [Nocardioides humi]|uniref:Ig-like domain (Group 3) n=1 Tax=Nocardioides humi TaxID=449461 RepID=A0ABN2AG20_9ACTN|nr:Ig-like domain-containing protein [Nocardioides humi]